MDERISFFRLGGETGAGTQRQIESPPVQPAAPVAAKPMAAKPVKPAAPARRGIVGRMQAAVATAFKADQEWDEF
jgi:hypothetical protein